MHSHTIKLYYFFGCDSFGLWRKKALPLLIEYMWEEKKRLRLEKTRLFFFFNRYPFPAQ